MEKSLVKEIIRISCSSVSTVTIEGFNGQPSLY